MRTESTPKPEDDRANEALLSGDGVGLLDHVLAWSLRNRLLVIVLMVLVTLYGVRAAFRSSPRSACRQAMGRCGGGASRTSSRQ